MKRYLPYILLLLFCACDEDPINTEKLFYSLNPSQSNVDFSNTLSFDQDFNIYTYRNYYNGGGVGIGDFDNDGFMDIYFTANMLPNRLYRNNGDLTFTDITAESGVAGNRKWSTGVSIADVNGDGLADIYICNSGDLEGDNKQNELFINQGDGTFIEMAEELGLADRGFSTHAAFFDYDKDGDLDMYLLNNSFQAIGSFNLNKNERPIRSPEGGDKLYRNDDGIFTDVSVQAGIYGSVIGFGLGVTVGDIDLDGWQDIFISNDFFERDYIYMNNGDGTFTEDLVNQMKSISGASMGADMADINNDGFPEIFVTEMLPEPNDRFKTKTTFENWDKYRVNVDNGYYHQFTRNMLQLNNGNNKFSEIGRLSGVEATDWSWGALINDFDNDGNKDLFIANGIYKDLTDQDYINYVATPEMAQKVISKDGVDFRTLTDVIPSNKVPNYMYRNTGQLQFENVTQDWGLDSPSHSNGSAYADLDNDGDLDLVINNVNDLASIYINNQENINSGSNYLKINLVGNGKNTQGVGARIKLICASDMYYYEQVPVRGFQSSMDPRINIGLAGHEKVDSIIIYWNNGTLSTISDIEANQTITINQSELANIEIEQIDDDDGILFTDVTAQTGIEFIHKENSFIDFDRDRLLYHMLSAEGPALCKGDLNGDGLEDLYVGGASQQSGALFLANSDGSFSVQKSTAIEDDNLSEDVDCTCFDADGDGDLDIYVASGGNEFPNSSSALIDRLYINDGNARFSKSNQILPSFKFQNSSTVEPSDIDNDGDLDLFVGVRAIPFLIGVPADGNILINDGNGIFKNATNALASELIKIGMISDGSWSDYDDDGDDDLFVVGEWMNIELFENQNGKLVRNTKNVGLDSTNGWWNSIEAADIDKDGDTDYILGNHGLNSRFKASRTKPVKMYVNDFDQNGSAEAIVCSYFGDESYPIALKHDLTMQLPSLRKKFVKYDSYKDQKIEDIFTLEILERAVKLEAYYMESAILYNMGADGFTLEALPVEAQLSPVYGIVVDDIDDDGYQDILLGGNFYNAKPEVGRYDASYGALLSGSSTGEFHYLNNRDTGLQFNDQVRSIITYKQGQSNLIFVANNNSDLKVYSY